MEEEIKATGSVLGEDDDEVVLSMLFPKI